MLSAKKGIHLFSAGLAWESAFAGALQFLEQSDGIVLLGPGVGESAKEWLEDQHLRKKSLQLGARVEDWQEWVKGRARVRALSDGRAFKVLNQPSQREFFRQTLMVLDEAGAFHHLKDLWQEEQFFCALLSCVEEARFAGLHEASAIERAQEMLASGSDAITREVYEDFWGLLLAFETRLRASGEFYDKPALARLAMSSVGASQERDLFLLGFDALSLVEVDLVQTLAAHCAVKIPVALDSGYLRQLMSAKEISLDHTAASLVRGLSTGFTGEIFLGEDDGASDSLSETKYLLSGHAPSEEVRAAAALGRQVLASGNQIRFILPKDELEGMQEIFREELGLPKNFHARKTLAHPIARLFFHALELKESNYSLGHALELAQLLQFSLGKFGGLPTIAAKAGIREGLDDWRKKSAARDLPELQSFVEFLEKIDGLIPARASCLVFSQGVTELAELCGIGELARLAPNSETEKEAHAALSAVLRNAQMLAASVKEPMDFPDWMRELTALLSSAKANEGLSYFPSVQFYEYGNWLPPAAEGAVTIALRWDASVGPSRAFGFYFEEGARRKLSDLLLPSQVQEELSFLDSMKRIARTGTAIFSWSRHDARGKELQPSWAASALPFVKEDWPEVARPLAFEGEFRASVNVKTRRPELPSLSASLLELYKECPFRALALKVLRLEDKMQASSLDVGPRELGNIVHRTLELYYGEHKGKTLAAEARAPLLEACLGQAVTEQTIDYFKGGEELLGVQVNRLQRMLLEFLGLDAENYEKFPHFRDPEVEQKVEGMIGPHKWVGKVDRIDLDEENKKLLVVDYKTGGTTPASGELKNLERFQLQLYMDAAEAMHPGFEAAGGLYVSLRTGERKQGMVRKEFNRKKEEALAYFEFHSRTGSLLGEEEFSALREATRAEALRIADAVQEGIFAVIPLEEETCKRCEVRPACRIREIQAPARGVWARVIPDFSRWLTPPGAQEVAKKKDKGFNNEQQDALDRAGELVFIEASAGTGKTTVIVEKIRRFLAARLALGDPSHRAVERFAAISFTDKSAQELKTRVGEALMQTEGMGPGMAAQGIRQISTIHGFCRRILSDFPVEAGVSPMAGLMDEREAEALRTAAFEDFFLRAPEEARPILTELFLLFPRTKVEGFLRKVLGLRLLVAEDINLYQQWFRGEIEQPGNLVAPGVEKEALRAILELAEHFQLVYERLKKEKEVLDFNDLENLSLKVLRLPQVREHYREKFSLLLVDEFQDTNSVQREILESIAQPEGKNLFVVGDGKQSIYRFRAADVSVFRSLREKAAEAGNLVSLFRNYRSRQELVGMANQVTQSVFPAPGAPAADFEAVAAEALAFRGEGGKISWIEYGDPENKMSSGDRRDLEATLLVESIEAQIARGRQPGDIAVLLRKMSGNEAYLRALTHAGIPFRVGSSRGFYSQSVVLDGIALLRSLYSAGNDMAVLAVLRSPWVRLSDDAILMIQKRGGSRTPLWESLLPEDAPLFYSWRKRCTFLSFSELLAEAYRHYPLDRREHLQTIKLLSIIRAMEADALPRVEILDRLSLWAGWEREEDSLDDSTMPEPGSGGAVQVMTVHSAKGLEFDVTILPDLAASLMPDRSPLRVVPGVGMALKLEEEDRSAAYDLVGEKNKERDLAESKRLLYVAVTRAKEECIFLLPKKAPDKKEKKKESWADWLRDSGLASAGSESSLEKREAAVAPLKLGKDFGAPNLALRTTTSITELAALQFCEEFHRRKFVQGWDDQVVALWPTPAKSFQRNKDKGKISAEREEALALLKKLGIQSKERGIALHRVLERVQSLDLSVGELWLTEAYVAQGVEESEGLSQLVQMDLKLLGRFLNSPLGRELFSSEVEAFPEISFQWNVGGALVHGAIDRLIRRPDGAWVVVDYKSSILEESRERYRFQVASYMEAVRAHAFSLGEKEPVVHGFLVDLYESKSFEVSLSIEEARLGLEKELNRLRRNYTLTDKDLDFSKRGIVAGEHCFSCPYSLHCDLGSKFVLAFR